jgi:hypothetical protein
MVVAETCLFQAELVDIVLGPTLSPSLRPLLRGLILTPANIALPVALWMFGRALNAAGLSFAGSRGSRTAFTSVIFVLAAVLVHKSLLASTHAVGTGELTELPNLISDVGDLVAIVLTAPLIYNVATLWGGRLSWTYVLLAASNICWLLFDGAAALQATIGGSLRLTDGCRLSALLFVAGTGLAQVWVLKQIRAPKTRAAAKS